RSERFAPDRSNAGCQYHPCVYEFAARRNPDQILVSSVTNLKTKPPAESLHFTPDPLDNTRLANLCGPMDENLRQISAALDVTLFRRGEKFIASGTNAQQAIGLLEKFYGQADKPVNIEDIQLAIVEKR